MLCSMCCVHNKTGYVLRNFNTDQGWKTFNFNPEQFNYKSGEEGIDNRIEMISQHEHDWLAFETELLACRIEQ